MNIAYQSDLANGTNKVEKFLGGIVIVIVIVNVIVIVIVIVFVIVIVIVIVNVIEQG